MCPACIATAGTVVASVVSTGGVGVLVLKVLGKNKAEKHDSKKNDSTKRDSTKYDSKEKEQRS
jgi:hypothetical protein